MLPKIKIKYKRLKSEVKIFEHISLNDKIIKPLNPSDDRAGVRMTFLRKRQGIVIKAEPFLYAEDFPTQTAREILLYKKITKQDLQYFPKLLGKGRNGIYVVTEYIDLDLSYKKCEPYLNLIRKLKKKYGLIDVGVFNGFVHNFGINKQTGKPVIFDLGQ